jgi:nitroreductase
MKNELFELVSRRRSVRQYGDKTIDDQIIDEIMKVALTAPSSFGHRSIHAFGGQRVKD